MTVPVELKDLDAKLNRLLEWAAKHDGRHEGFEKALAEHSAVLFGNDDGKSGLKFRVHEAESAIKEIQDRCDGVCKAPSKLWVFLLDTFSMILAAFVIGWMGWMLNIFKLH